MLSESAKLIANMSKPISISFGKSKSSMPTKSATPTIRTNGVSTSKPALLRADSDDEDEKQPVHETVTGFTSNGVVLAEPAQKKSARMIKNSGNGNWRQRKQRGKNLLPGEVQAQRESGGPAVERDEVSTAGGLQLATKQETTSDAAAETNGTSATDPSDPQPVLKEQTEGERALQALLSNGEAATSSTVITIRENENINRSTKVDETEDYRADVATRPDSSTLDEYAAMPVEEFGMAMLRGMGQKRKANGEMVSYSTNNDARKERKIQQGFLGIGAKAAPGMEVELGAWGKTAMRQGLKGKSEGMYTPLMLKNKQTGELITEDELQARKKEAKAMLDGREGDWRERRDRNLGRGHMEQKKLTNGDEDYREAMNGFSKSHKDDRPSPSRRHRSRSKDRRRYHDDDRDDKYRDRDSDKRRDKYREDDRYDSSSSRKSSHRDKERAGHDRDEDRRRRDKY